MKGCLLFLILILATACASSPRTTASQAPPPGGTSTHAATDAITATLTATRTATATSTPTRTPTSTPVPTPVGGGSGSLLIADGASFYKVDLNRHAETVVMTIQDVLSAEFSFDQEDTYYLAEFSPDTKKILFYLGSNQSEDLKTLVIADLEAKQSASLPLDLKDRFLVPEMKWSPDSMNTLIQLSPKDGAMTNGYDTYVVSAAGGDFGEILRWDPAFTHFWSADGENINFF